MLFDANTGQLTFSQGETVTFDVAFTTWTPTDAWLQIRATESDAATLLSLTTAAGLSIAARTVTVTISSTQTAALEPGFHAYDLLVAVGGGREFGLPTAVCRVERAVTRGV